MMLWWGIWGGTFESLGVWSLSLGGVGVGFLLTLCWEVCVEGLSLLLIYVGWFCVAVFVEGWFGGYWLVYFCFWVVVRIVTLILFILV